MYDMHQNRVKDCCLLVDEDEQTPNREGFREKCGGKYGGFQQGIGIFFSISEAVIQLVLLLKIFRSSQYAGSKEVE